MNDSFSPLAAHAFELLFHPWMRTRVHAVRITGLSTDIPPDRPLILAANHVSWFDGFVLREMQRRLRPGAPYQAVMTASELRRFPFFRRLGVVGIDRAAPSSVARALRVLQARTRERPDAVLVYFPQGKIWPSHRRPLGFTRGIELFARRLGAITLPVALHLEPLQHIAPTVFAAVGEPLEPPFPVQTLERRVAAQLDAILALLASSGEEIARDWPSAYGRLQPPDAARPTARSTSS